MLYLPKFIVKGYTDMNDRKATKRALLTSVMALVMCVVMLVGTTFAWFTDTATTNVNKIQAGKLEVMLEMKDSNGNWVDAEGQTLNFVKAKESVDQTILWEPGATYQLPELQIKNAGNLALKYKINVSGAKVADGAPAESLKLLDVLEWTYTVDSETYALESEKHLTAGDSDTLVIKAHMKESANNDYQNMAIEGIAITVYATQDTVEYDSFTKDYDKDAKYTEVVAAGKAFTGKQTISTGITATSPNAIAVKAIGANADVTIEDGTFDGGEGGNNICVTAANGAKVTIKGGTFTVGGDADGYGNSVVYSQGGNIMIEGGFFYTDCSYGGRYYVLNQSNGNPGTITVKGGTFVNYDPSKGDDNLGGNFVADGYSVISETKDNGDVWYTVVEGTVVNSNEEFNAALKAASEGSKIILNCNITELTLTKEEIPAGITIDGQSKYSIARDAYLKLVTKSITLQNVTFG